jgi:hypothetical protein
MWAGLCDDAILIEKGYNVVVICDLRRIRTPMRLRSCALALLILFCMTTLMVYAQTAADPLSGTWAGTWGPTPTHRNDVTVELKWDGKALTGTVNPGPNAVKVMKTSFNAATRTVHMEADSTSMGKTVHFVIDGKVDQNTFIGSWNHDDKKGDFKLAKK